MADSQKVRLQILYGTTNDWTNGELSELILQPGEIGLNTTTGEIRYGKGEDYSWGGLKSLGYVPRVDYTTNDPAKAYIINTNGQSTMPIRPIWENTTHDYSLVQRNEKGCIQGGYFMSYNASNKFAKYNYNSIDFRTTSGTYTFKFPEPGGILATQDWVNMQISNSGGGSVNLTSGTGAGSIQQLGYNDVLGAVASGDGAVALGGQRFDKVGKPTSEEPQTEAKGIQSFAQGGGVVVEGDWSVGFNKDTRTYQKASFACGGGTQAGDPNADPSTYSFAFAEGNVTQALGKNSHAGGNATKAIGESSSAWGRLTEAIGICTYAGGWGSKTYTNYSFAHGAQLETNKIQEAQTVFGRYNKQTKSPFIIGGGTGTASTQRSNLFEIRNNGDVCILYGGVMYSLHKILEELKMFKTDNQIDLSNEVN